MNSSPNNASLLSICSLERRVYTPAYLFFKLLNATYLRGLIGPGILLNTLCLIVLSRPRLSSRSTTIVFLRFLALFDILAITLKYIRAEINYQSTEKNRHIALLVPPVCKTLYVLMNASISIAMWTIVLMSLDKAIAVTYPLKASIWLTQKRVFYICCLTIGILLTANLSFIKFSDIRLSRTKRSFCGLAQDSFIVDLLTASILPIALITGANIVIAIVLHRVSFDWSASDGKHGKRDSDGNEVKNHVSNGSIVYRTAAGSTATTTADLVLAAKRRTNAQVTRMLLAVTLSLIICNIPNTIFFILVKVYDTRQLLIGRVCSDVSDEEINLYKFGFYFGVFQDILSDLPHIVNFFLYCLAGRKFRSIFINEVENFLRELHIIKGKQRRFTQGSTYPCQIDSPTGGIPAIHSNQPAARSIHQPMFYQVRLSMDMIYTGSKSPTTVLNSSTDHHQPLLCSSKGLLRSPSFPRTRRSPSSDD